MTGAAIRLEAVSKAYRLYEKPEDRLKQAMFRRRRFFTEVDALQPISLTINRGEAVGVMGRNGSGKSTFLQIIAGTLTPTGGSIEINGRLAALLELGAGFNPEFTGKENVYLNAALLGLNQSQIDERYAAIQDFAEIGAFIDRPVKTYSTGMYMRLAFAVSVSVEPDILIIDEALSVGDEAFQRKCFDRLDQFKKAGGTLLFVSHAPGAIIDLCSRALLLNNGHLLIDDEPKTVVNFYQRLLYDHAVDEASLVRAIAEHQALGAPVSPEPSSNAAGGAELAAGEDFDPNLIPSSRNAYEPNGGQIEDPHLATLSGQRVNTLIRGRRYRYRFKVHLDQARTGVRCGMYIRTKTGMDLGGAGSELDVSDLVDAKAGETIEAEFQFTCRLLPGTYFLNAGCSALADGQRFSVHRILDAAMFRVAPEPGLHKEGLVDFDIEGRIDVEGRIEPAKS